MQITIDQHEIEEAIQQFIHNKGIDLTGQAISIEFTMGKKPNGPRATVDIGEPEDTSEEEVPEDSENEPGIPFTFTQAADSDNLE